MSTLIHAAVRPVWKPTRQVLVFEQLVTSVDIGRIARALKQKKHAHLGFYYDAEDMGTTIGKFMRQHVNNPQSPYHELHVYGDDRYNTRHGQEQDAFILRVYRDVLTA